ncbi:MAG: hypothetical protein JXB39_05155 [Deltaproteobacteria bacterium]|nr:hypothetical protein [Deltaproteobacteria bacterium]
MERTTARAVGLVGLLFLALQDEAWGAPAVRLPAGEDPARWSAALRLAGLEAAVDGAPAMVVITALPRGWEVWVHGRDGATRHVRVIRGTSVAMREDAAFLAASMLQDTALVEWEPGSPDPVPILAAPPRPLPVAQTPPPAPRPVVPKPPPPAPEPEPPAPPPPVMAEVLVPPDPDPPDPPPVEPQPVASAPDPDPPAEPPPAHVAVDVRPTVGLLPAFVTRQELLSGGEAAVQVGVRIGPLALLGLEGAWRPRRALLAMSRDEEVSALDVRLDLGIETRHARVLAYGGLSRRSWWASDALVVRTGHAVGGVHAGVPVHLSRTMALLPGLRLERDLGATTLQEGDEEPVPLAPWEWQIGLGLYWEATPKKI